MDTLEQLTSGNLAGIKRLSLAQGLLTFPDAILSLADSLEILDLSNNQLSELPNSLAQLKKLKIIFLSNNQFEVLPEVLGQCENLEMIGIKSNKIHAVPASSLPPKLRWLTLTDNKIKTLPDSLGGCPRLQKLMLAGNQLTELPQTLSQCHNLELIRISANQLTAFPEQLLALPKLAWLAFAGNPFSQSNDHSKPVPEIASSTFTIKEQLGQGASGIISTAEWNTPQTDFTNDIAVKVFKGGITSDGYPADELKACLKVGQHSNLVESIAQVNETGYSALIMKLIPDNYKNLGLPPNFDTCSRDIFPADFLLPIELIHNIINQINDVFEHIHNQQVLHGDLYAHNTLLDQQGQILFGDFGAASMYHMLNELQQTKIKRIEQRALHIFINEMLSLCRIEEREKSDFKTLQKQYAS